MVVKGGRAEGKTLFQTTISTLIFNTWGIEELIPQLSPKSVVVMDNASFHKRNIMQKSLKNKKHTFFYFPPYFPDLNPIEHKWA